MILPYAQNRAFNKLFYSQEWRSAYQLQESLATLRALVKKGLLVETQKLGSILDPRTNIFFKRKG